MFTATQCTSAVPSFGKPRNWKTPRIATSEAFTGRMVQIGIMESQVAAACVMDAKR
jgi:hypothetical protein